ncbi:MAG: hypothetical protein ACM35H_05775 [Bacteroidota bacterium]|nr:hypothetical protein [Kiloniellaceae bacterium]
MSKKVADKETRDALHAEALRLQRAAMSGVPIPMPQRTAMKGHAQAMFEQWLELEAARFNTTSEDYKAAIDGLNGAIKELKAEIDALDNAIRTLERATEAIKAGDALLKLAIENLPISPF